MKIKTLSMEIKFHEPINFYQIPESFFYNVIYKKIKKLICVDKLDCGNCTKKITCTYNYLSGADFRNIDKIPVIIDFPVFPKHDYGKGALLKINYKFLGRAADLIEYFIYALISIEDKGITKENSKITLNKLEIHDLDLSLPKEQTLMGLKLITPASKIDFNYERDKLNSLFSLQLPQLEISYTPNTFEMVYKNKIKLGDRKFNLKGSVGNIDFSQSQKENTFYSLLSITGMGDQYALGGGKVRYIL